ncbi:hypothetical protein B296_00012720 [Ensete ventricosum]|uniref:Uncharacterized protein n=1 Tax=Ensete ventricosum TaxID=4639 RepID=A0A427B769_ENSVE|nr:hypothetical protein B296_00012720 [Ensete ventricosum]
MMKIEGFLKHQLVTILIDIGSTNNFVDNKVAARLTLQIKDCSRSKERIRAMPYGLDLRTDSKVHLILYIPCHKWKLRENDLA